MNEHVSRNGLYCILVYPKIQVANCKNAEIALWTWIFGYPHFQTQPFMDEYGWYVLVCDVFGGQLGNSRSGKSIDICRLVFYIRSVKANIRI